jgi:hypothetical protein
LIVKVVRVKGIGWNMLARYENAWKLVEEGLTKNDIQIRFIYSNKNELRADKKSTFVEKGHKQTYLEKSSSAVEGSYKAEINRK